MNPNFTTREYERYSRHMLLPDFGIAAQEKIKSARVLVIGSGGLGSPVLQYLAAAGVGTLGIVDFDVVDLTNLQRQVIHCTETVGQPKVKSAARAIAAINPHVDVEVVESPFTADNAEELVDRPDLLIDCTDNFPTRYLVNDACELAGKPYVYGSIFQFEGQASVFNFQGGPTYRDLYPEPPEPGLIPNCAIAGVLGILPGLIGMIQATEAVKIITGKGEVLSGRLLLYNALKMQFRELKLRKNPKREPVTQLIDYEVYCGSSVQLDIPAIDPKFELSAHELAQKLESSEIFLLDIRERTEREICKLENSYSIPLKELESRLAEIPKSMEIVTYCRTGIRSIAAVNILHAAGFTEAKHLRGGVYAWSEAIDPAMPKY